MSAILQPVDPAPLVARLHAVLDELQALDLTALDEPALLDYLRELERARRRFPTLDHAAIVEIDVRGLPGRYGVRTMRGFVRGLLRLDPQEAHARVAAAAACARGRSLAGQPLPARYEPVAAAQQIGLISDRHARLITATVEQLPARLRDEQGGQLVEELVDYAGRFDPAQLARLARRLAECLDPDGALAESRHRHQQRHLDVHQRPDGSATMSGQLTAEAAELLLTHFDAFAAPRPPVDGVKDARTAGQRRHDALLEALKANLRARQLPTVAGVTCTLIATMTAEQYATGTGLARTAHGATVPVPDVLAWAGGDYRLFTTVTDTLQGVTHYSHARRLFSETQRLALIAADGGCTFPDCPVPALWCEADHTTDHAHGGPTTLANAALLCDPHNRTAKKQGWQPRHINGRVAWIPPPWIDPRQEPRYNNLHRPDDLR